MTDAVGKTRVLVAIDESCHEPSGWTAVRWAAKNLAGSNKVVHIVTVLPPSIPELAMAPSLGIRTPEEAQRAEAAEVAKATLTLKAAVLVLVDQGAPQENVRTHVLTAAGHGASGVAESIIAYAESSYMDVVVLGSRGMGAIKRSLMPMVGLGSVSDYCTHQMKVPVIIVRSDTHFGEKYPQAPRVICLAVDDSPHSAYALTWTLKHVMRDNDVLQLITVAVPVPFWPMLDAGEVSITEMTAQQVEEQSMEYAQDLLAMCKANIVRAWHADKVKARCLTFEAGAKNVAPIIAEYAKAEKVDLLVVGARGLGSFKRSMMSLVGLGSVSDHLVHGVSTCPVAVVKAAAAQLPPPGPRAAAARQGRAAGPADGSAEAGGAKQGCC